MRMSTMRSRSLSGSFLLLLSMILITNTEVQLVRAWYFDSSTEEVVAQPTSLQGESLTPNSIQLSWDVPEDSWDSIQSFELYYNESHSHQKFRITISPPKSSYVLQDLTPDTVYHIRVAATSHYFEGNSTSLLQVHTQEYTPGEPRGVIVESINSTAIMVEWKSLNESRNGIIRGYLILFTKVDENEDPFSLLNTLDTGGEKIQVMVRGLQPDSWYQFQVAAYTRKGVGPLSKSQTAKTNSAVPSAPRGLRLALVGRDPPVVAVEWQRPQYSHGNLRSYKVVFGVRGDSMVQERRIREYKTHFTTGYLDYGVTYEFRISAQNAVDFGEEAVQIIRTPDGIPRGAPLNFSTTEISSTSVKLSWCKPEKRLRNGAIEMYEISYYETPDPMESFSINTTNLNIIIESLDINSNYLFRIKAYTSRGAGPWSSPLPVRTLGQLPPPPTNIQVRHTSLTALEVSWDPPVDIANIAGYRVYYNMFAVPDMNEWQSVELAPALQVEINGLEPHTIYAVRVRSKSTDGHFGNFSDIKILGQR